MRVHRHQSQSPAHVRSFKDLEREDTWFSHHCNQEPIRFVPRPPKKALDVPGLIISSTGTLEGLTISDIRRRSVSTDRGASPTWLSQEAFDRLQTELDTLIANRSVIAAEINARREEGDLRENGGYHAAREEQGKAEGRILYLKELLHTAKVGVAPTTGNVAPGTVVTIQFDDDPDDTETFLLGAREISATTELTVYSPESALGKAIIGATAGDTISYTAPNGSEIKVKVLKFTTFGG
ncbi:MAG: transcription elongation factor GreA [Micromonosporaceae bacterium]|nr:transcription elongation factor GreA [Micromonosporaceae bacterium]